MTITGNHFLLSGEVVAHEWECVKCEYRFLLYRDQLPVICPYCWTSKDGIPQATLPETPN